MEHKTTPAHAPISASAKRLRNLFFAALGVLVLLNVFIHPHHPHFGLETLPGFWALFGLAGAVLLAKGAKGLAHTVLGKPEDYYEEHEKGSGFRVQDPQAREPHPHANH
jgi:hypothetical protein